MWLLSYHKCYWVSNNSSYAGEMEWAFGILCLKNAVSSEVWFVGISKIWLALTLDSLLALQLAQL